MRAFDTQGYAEFHQERTQAPAPPRHRFQVSPRLRELLCAVCGGPEKSPLHEAVREGVNAWTSFVYSVRR